MRDREPGKARVAAADRDARPIAALVGALARAVRALGYYDASHPVFTQARTEVLAAAERASWSWPELTLGSAGAHLVYDTSGAVLDDEPARVLADRMFKASIVAIHVGAGATARDVDALVSLLAESAARIRDAGGASALFAPADPSAVWIADVDFGALFAGETADLGPLVRGDPVAELALRHVLRFKEDGAGAAVGLSLEALATPESLGEWLDELLDDAEPGVLAEPERRADAQERTGPSSGAGADELADRVARAFQANQATIASREGGSDEALAKSAEVLASALVRLAPDARFALLRRLAGGEDADVDAASLARLGPKVPDRAIVDAIAAALVDQRGDSDAVRAIGNLIRRLRPVEAERAKVLATLDRAMSERARPIDGVLWQELQAKALARSNLGLLEVDLAAHRAELSALATERLRGALPAVPGQEIVTTSEGPLLRAAARTLGVIAREPRPLAPAIVDAIRGLVDALDRDGVSEEGLELVRAVMARADAEAGGATAALVRELLAGARGAERLATLTRVPGEESRMSGELLLRALASPGDRAHKERLFERLASFDAETLKALASDLRDPEPHRVHHLARALLRVEPAAGVKLVRVAVRVPSTKVKEAALRALSGSTDRDALGLLAGLAGWKGERVAKGLAGELGGNADDKLHALQLLAIELLGASRSRLAVEPLVELAETTKLITTRQTEELRAAAATALAAMGTAEAKQALDALRAHKKKAVREAAERAIAARRPHGG
ncbi:hypothetical protein L6R52_30495 [Myxococcota bacterium]|nr:hypothetical protein [Myxococcota bacterium]